MSKATFRGIRKKNLSLGDSKSLPQQGAGLTQPPASAFFVSPVEGCKTLLSHTPEVWGLL